MTPLVPSLQRKLNSPQFFAALFIIAISAVAIIDAANLPFGNLSAPDAGFIPMIEGMLFACTGVTLLVDAFISRPTVPVKLPENKDKGRRVMFCLSAALVVYIVVLPILGFTISTALFLWAAISFWRFCSIFVSAVLALVMTSGLYAVFVIALQMPLPHGVLIPF